MGRTCKSQSEKKPRKELNFKGGGANLETDFTTEPVFCEPRFSDLFHDTDVEALKPVLPLLLKTHFSCIGVCRIRVDAIVLNDIEEGTDYIATVAAVVSKPHGAVQKVLGTEGD